MLTSGRYAQGMARPSQENESKQEYNHSEGATARDISAHMVLLIPI